MRPIKATVGSPGWYAPEETFFILQFLVEEGSPGPWKISLQAMQGSPGGSLYRLPVPLTKAGEDLFTILRHVPTMGKMAEARPLKPVVQAATSIPNHTQQPRRFLGAQQGLANSTGTVGSSIAAPPIQQAANKTHLPHHQNASPPATKTTRLPVLVPAPPAQSPSHTIAAAPVKSSPHPTAVGPTRITVTNSQLAPPQRSSYSTMHHGQPVQQEQWGYARPDHLAPAIRPVTAAPATARSSPTVYPTYDITTNRAANQPSKSQYHTPRTATYGTTPQRLANPSVNQPSDSTWQYHTTPTTNFPVHGASPANQSSRSAQYHATRPATSSSGYYQSRSTNHTNQTPAAANGDHPGHSAPDGENDSSTYSTIATFTAIFGGAVLVLHAFRTWL
ncbi:hypothetical protein NEOLEDRAFT_769140 [Neolentinus lepideus HHB14362 ss-1]|uniref:Uncharacterized protein n=1 Tax=Neolentinus lepideus HHB14362 ss-1 TaxID=1314782 RepID=A0A165UTJ5_9AGAM|nr:hypothetical protein NEOLEDRAFT_769140 [Neolentinus lepideus HHB14362 ss-1]